MKKILFYLFCMVCYLGLCLLCDIVFEDKFIGTFWEGVVRALTFVAALAFIGHVEKKGWNSWSKVLGLFKRH